MQNTSIRRFRNNPYVEALNFQQGDWFDETEAWVRDYWSIHFLRYGPIWHADGNLGRNYFGQPDIELPFGRGFIIDQRG